MQEICANTPESMYENERYLALNESWHVEDSPWKAEQVLKLLHKHQLEAKTICEVGCGAGEILVQLSQRLPDVKYTGYDISPQLAALWKEREKYGITFIRDDFLDGDDCFDVLLFIDVIEHIEDYIGFLRKVKGRGTYTVFNFSSEIFALKALLGHKYVDSRARYGHLHFFNKDICLALLDDLHFTVVDWYYAPSAIDLAGTSMSVSPASRLLKLPRIILGKLSTELSAKLLGGYSLFILAI